jgi:hypothetical protein
MAGLPKTRDGDRELDGLQMAEPKPAELLLTPAIDLLVFVVGWKYRPL